MYCDPVQTAFLIDAIRLACTLLEAANVAALPRQSVEVAFRSSAAATIASTTTTRRPSSTPTLVVGKPLALPHRLGHGLLPHGSHGGVLFGGQLRANS